MSSLIVALDFSSIEEATAVARSLATEVAGFKVGLELLTGVGPGAISEIADLGLPVFADAKLHDIPNTVHNAASRIAAAGARWVTVHASGGREMMEAAVTGMGGAGVLAVTVLTSLSADDLESIGIRSGLEKQVLTLAGLAAAAGVEGLVCAPSDVSAVRNEANGLTIFTPGIRVAGAAIHDQKRVGTPESAVAHGADYLVIGRPITRAPDPVVAAREISRTLNRSG